MSEEWRPIPEFPNYHISNYGQVYNTRDQRIMRTSLNNYGHVKITLKSPHSSERFTRQVSVLVAEAFIEPPNWMCDCVIILDGDYSNVAANNLAWRPKWYAWKYTHQLKVRQPVHYHNLIIYNEDLDFHYKSIVEAGMIEGLLFDDIWRSTYTGAEIFPYGHVYSVVDRV